MQSSDISSSIESYVCAICHEQYNDSNRAPRVVCSEIHNICTECLKDMLKQPGKKFVCPLDRLEDDKKPLSEYRINRDLVKLLQMAQDFVKASSRKTCSGCQADATRLCLNCTEAQCSECMLDDRHEGHKHFKLSDVPKMVAEKKSKLAEEVARLEASGKEEASSLVKNKEKELKEKANMIFEDYQRMLADKKEAVINEIKKKLAELSSNFLAKKPKTNKKSNAEVLKWISDTKRITQQTVDVNNILCELYKQEKRLGELETNKSQGTESKEELLFNNALKKISLEFNELFVENFKKYSPVKFGQNNNSAYEEVKHDHSSFERRSEKRSTTNDRSVYSFRDSESELSDSNGAYSDYQFEPFVLNDKRNSSSPIHARNKSQQQSLDWIENGSKSEKNPVQEEMQQLREAFEDTDLDVQVKFVKASNAIRLDSMYEKTKAPSSGFKGDEGVEKFFKAVSKKELAPALKKVISLNLICLGLTKSGAFNLSKIVDKLPALEVLRVEFFNSGDMRHEDLKPFMLALGRSKNLSTLSLSCQKWRYLQNFNLPYTIGDLALISKLKNLTLNFSECHSLTTIGITEAFHSFPSLLALEDLKISFNGCKEIGDDESCLHSIYQVYSKMAKLKKIEFDFLKCPGFTKRGKNDLTGPSKVNARLVCTVNID